MNAGGTPVADPLPSRPVTRAELLRRLEMVERWDLLVVGGGATGLGVALDAVARGLSVVLIEAEDFSKGTSSRATKLVHGGVRYLARGNLRLVREALHERTRLLNNAPHLVQPLAFVMPVYGMTGRWFRKWFYGIGLVMYDLLAGKAGLGKTEFLNAAAAAARAPGVKTRGLTGAVQYWDAQFDDAGFAMGLARTAIGLGACVVNYCKAIELLGDSARIGGAVAEDVETGVRYRLAARCVVNATGVWVDQVRRMADPRHAALVAPSQGVHLVVDREFLPAERAILMPRTLDGRVLFAIPWYGKTLLGTTDTPCQDLELEPRPLAEETDFILREAGRYLEQAPAPPDIRSIWVGLRPLVRPLKQWGSQTKALSRAHTVVVDHNGLVTVTGGKWTTYRVMAEDVIKQCVAAELLPECGPSRTAGLRLIGAPEHGGVPLSQAPGAHRYGTEAELVASLPGADRKLAVGLTEAMVRFAARYEQARSVEDVLARRSRLLFLDAAQAKQIAPDVADILAEELGSDFDASASAKAFQTLARQYQELP